MKLNPTDIYKFDFLFIFFLNNMEINKEYNISFNIGIGVGLATSAAFVALNHYFKEKRGQAVGLSMAGTALGMLILPQLVRILLEVFGFRGAVLCLSGLALHAAVGSMLLQPVKRHLKEVPIDVELQQCTIVEPIKENAKDDDNDDLPELNNLIFTNNKKMRKNYSEVAISSMNKGMSKNPTFARIMRATSNVGMHSSSDLSAAVRKRRASVISHLSQLDFTGSSVHVHMNVSINYILFNCTLFLYIHYFSSL